MRPILLVCEYPTLYGGERSLLAMLERIRPQLDRELLALARGASPLAHAFQRLGIEVLPVEWRTSAGHRRPLDEARRLLAVHVERLRPALLHANSLAMARLAGPVTRGLGVPSLGHIRDIVRLSRQAVDDVNRLDRLLAVSHATREAHVAQGLHAQHIEVLYNGVALDEFCPGPPRHDLRAELGLPPDTLLVGTIGQLVRRKGIDVLAAAAQSIEPPANAHWVIAGARHSHKAEAVELDALVRAQLAASPWRDRIHFLGERDDVSAWLPGLDLLVHAARQEPLGRVLLEAAACGLPIVATDVGGTREIFCASPLGDATENATPQPDIATSTRWPAALLVPPGDPRPLAAAVTRLLAARDERARLGQAARRVVALRFDLERATVALVAHYRALVARGAQLRHLP